MITDSLAWILEELEGLGPLYRAGSGYQAHCPSHEDRLASLSVGMSKDGKVLLHCFAGCETQDVLAALKITWADLFPAGYVSEPEKWSNLPLAKSKGHLRREIKSQYSELEATYNYFDHDGTLLFQVLRFNPKGFSQRKPDGKGGWIYSVKDVKRTIYRMGDLRPHDTVFVVEGEKDADRLWSEGHAATTAAGGAGQWPDDTAISSLFAGKRVYIIPDQDHAGEAHAHDVLTKLTYYTRAYILRLPPGFKDISVYLDAGGTVEQLIGGVGAASND